LDEVLIHEGWDVARWNCRAGTAGAITIAGVVDVGGVRGAAPDRF
jgi:hypothetical protein